jgi:hypothetical protein
MRLPIGMTKTLIVCAMILGLAVTGIFVNLEFNPLPVHTQPAPATERSP